MSATRWIQIAVVSAAMAGSGAAFAGGTHARTHHCKLPDGTMDMKKTHKQCTEAKGTWAKDAPAAAKDAPAAKPPAPKK